jgi:hypothetical protein
VGYSFAGVDPPESLTWPRRSWFAGSSA